MSAEYTEKTELALLVTRLAALSYSIETHIQEANTRLGTYKPATAAAEPTVHEPTQELGLCPYLPKLDSIRRDLGKSNDALQVLLNRL